MARADKLPEAELQVPVNPQSSYFRGRGSSDLQNYPWWESFFLEVTILLFKLQLELFILGEQLQLIVFITLCSPVQVKSKIEENKSELSPFFCQEEVLFDFYLHPQCSLEKNMTFGNVQVPVDSPPTSFSVSIASFGTRALISFPVNDEAQMLWINRSLWGKKANTNNK